VAERIRLGSSYRKLYAATTISNIGDGMAGIAYPWLATAITRNPILVATVAVAQRLPWLVFTLPAGVITDRVDRRRVMVVMNTFRFAITALIAVAVLIEQDSLPAPDQVEQVIGTRAGLYALVVLATLLLGMAEVLHDNSAQTLMPSLVADEHLERANGRVYSAEMVANTFIGPPLGSLLLLVAFAAPFFVDAASFFAAAALVFLIPGTFRAERPDAEPQPWRTDLKEGFRWLWSHPVFRTMAIILGLMNLSSTLSGSMLVLFSQEVLGVTPLTFTLMGFGFAIGGIAGGYLAPWLSRTLGSGTCLALTLFVGAATEFLIGLSSVWPMVAALFGINFLFGATWNVITVSLRQSVIPAHLLGRVNSVYRFFAWGMMPIGALLGGTIVAVMSGVVGREGALRSVFFVSGAIHLALWWVGRRALSTERLEAVRQGPSALGATV
jgi:MFS family permease